MAVKKKEAQSTGPRWVLEGAAILIGAAALALGLSLGSYHPTDPSWGVEAPGAAVQNAIGPLGANLAYSFYEVLGFSAWVMPVLMAGFAALILVGHRAQAQLTKLVGALLVLVSAACLLEILFPEGVALRGGTVRAGGFLGTVVTGNLAPHVHVTGAALIAVTGLVLGGVLLTRVSVAAVGSRIASLAGGIWRACLVGLRSLWAATGGRIVKAVRAAAPARAQKRKARAEERAARAEARRLEREKKAEERQKLAAERAEARRLKREKRAEARREKQAAKEAAQAAAPVKVKAKEARAKAKAKARAKEAAKAPAVARKDKKKKEKRKPVVVATDGKPVSGITPVSAERAPSDYRLPSLDLLDRPDGEGVVDEEVLLHNSQVIVAKYSEFSIEGKVIQIHPGPIVTTYEFKPEAGVKYSRITGLAEDLCLALKAESIRIDRIPGKSTVGIEVPNAERQTIRLSEILDTDEALKARTRLLLAMGTTIEGEPYVADLAKMPHLLIAGSTGSGKSVCLNAMIASILLRATPEEVKFILIDPKRLELGLYQGTPHLYTPVVTDAKRAVNALQWAVHEMEDRYRKLAETAVRNIEQYNKHIRKAPVPEGEEPPETLPYLCIVVDELADLLLVTKGGVEESLARLAQMARAVGIHLILSTQRPSVDVLTGVIKANFPSRISFRVSSKVDSRTILDSNGAEQLLGKGDMLFMPPGTARLVRLHAPLLTEEEIGRITSFWKEQAGPQYREEVLEPPQPKKDGQDEEYDDDLYDQAARIVVDRQEASVSYLQRRLRIGYARAARLVDLMEQDGLVGPSPETGGKMREVLVEPNYFSEIDSVKAAQA
jgi:S-DNA-T family DNA segregation ATPase FtsK/SpoIIIE